MFSSPGSPSTKAVSFLKSIPEPARKLDGIVQHSGLQLRRFLKGSKPIMVAFGVSRMSVEHATLVTGVLEPQS